MGYTHYWTNTKTPSPEQWNRITTYTRKLISSTQIQLAFDFDKVNYSPIITPYEIQFNGVGKDGHETFHLIRWPQTEFCKTANKPYDLIVTAVLILAHSFAPDIWTITSDGDHKDWSAGLVEVRTVASQPIQSPI